MFMSVYNGQWL